MLPIFKNFNRMIFTNIVRNFYFVDLIYKILLTLHAVFCNIVGSNDYYY